MIKTVIFFITMTFLSGCVARHYVAVNSVVEPSIKVKRVYGLFYDRTRPENIDIEIRKVLASKGFVDINELKKLEEEIEKLSKELKKNVRRRTKRGNGKIAYPRIATEI
jgi:hypothetical protein